MNIIVCIDKNNPNKWIELDKFINNNLESVKNITIMQQDLSDNYPINEIHTDSIEQITGSIKLVRHFVHKLTKNSHENEIYRELCTKKYKSIVIKSPI